MADEPNVRDADQKTAPEQGLGASIAVPPEVAVHDRIMDAYYGKMGEDFMRKTQERVHWVCASVRGTCILDVGCSQGIVPILLGREGKRVVGIDTDSDAIAVAQAHMAAGPAHVADNVRFAVGDFMNWDFAGASFDTVVMSEVLEHLVDPSAFVARAAELLPEGGCLVVTVPFGINDFIDHKRTYYLAEAYRLLSRFFDVEEVELFGKWIGFRGARREKFFDRAHQPTIPYPVLAATEKTFYLLERSLADQAKSTRLQLLAANERVKEAGQKLAKVTASQASIQVQLDKAAARLTASEEARRQVEARAQEETAKAQGEIRRLGQQLGKTNASVEHYKTRAAVANAQLQFIRTTIAFQLGSILIHAFRSPVDFLKTPVRLFRLARTAFVRGADGRPREVFVPDLPALGMPTPVASRKATGAAASLGKASTDGSGLEDISILAWPAPVPKGKPVVMAVMDEFTAGCFENDLALVLPRPDNWRALAEKYPPAMFFIESAWKGNGGSWQYRVAEYNNRPGEELADMMLYASEQGIPTVFWNKEDPVHHQKFMISAKLADHIFSTDANMLDSYREKTGNNKVHALPFAAQPALHYPAPLDGREAKACFAGSWYGDRHEERGKNMRWLLHAANRHGLVIYDRNHGSGNFTFPEEYHASIKGGLPYKDLCAEYRRYRVFLNVNSVTSSPTMFSRRVFELMACGTPVVSTFARGIQELFESKSIWLVDSEEQAEEAIRALLSDDAEWRRRSLAGIREVFARHTYAHRLNKLFGDIGLSARLPVDPKILLFANADSDGEVERAIEIAKLQRYPSLELRIAAPVSETRRMQLGTTTVTIVPVTQSTGEEAGSTAAGIDAMGWISIDAQYGAGYVRDLANAMIYRPDARGWGKAIEGDAFAFGHPGHLQASVWRPEYFTRSPAPGALGQRLAGDHFFIVDRAEYAPAGVRIEVLEN
jgi:spore maturation protein CgeB/SAM-dependent methyltransferase